MIFAATAAAIACAATGQPLAFPGAEGAGAHALGGRGGRVIKVTTLADDGPGSLRAAIDAKGPRTIVFEVDGTIQLAKPLRIREPRVTIAGQSAPGAGITLRDQPLIVAADDVVVRFIRSRLGDESHVQTDAIDVVAGRRIVLDHVTASWSVDETLSVGSKYAPPESGVYDVTVQWSLIGPSMNHSGHDKGDHGYGSLIRGGYGAKFSFHHNLWAMHRARMPRPGNYNDPAVDPMGPLIEFRSNVFYDWGGSASGYNVDKGALATYAFVDNAYLPGPDSTGKLAFREENPGAKAWFAGNMMDGQVPADPWTLVGGQPPDGYRLDAAPRVGCIAADPAASALTKVLDGAGASRVRDGIDQAVIAGVRDRTGRIIDSQTAMGGWPELSRGTPRLDTDGDGMPDAWEIRHGLDPKRNDSAGDKDGDGYTNLEAWLAELAETRP